jgi:hypothetical protein
MNSLFQENNRSFQIKTFCETRKIVYLTHFTKIKNLGSILKIGLFSKEFLNKEKIPHEFNDQYRYDGCTNAICASVTFPNYKMFYLIKMVKTMNGLLFY